MRLPARLRAAAAQSRRWSRRLEPKRSARGPMQARQSFRRILRYRNAGPGFRSFSLLPPLSLRGLVPPHPAPLPVGARGRQNSPLPVGQGDARTPLFPLGEEGRQNSPFRLGTRGDRTSSTPGRGMRPPLSPWGEGRVRGSNSCLTPTSQPRPSVSRLTEFLERPLFRRT